MAEARRSPATWADLERFPEGVNAEVIAGEVVVSPRSRPAHGLAQAALASAVVGSFGLRRPPGGWWIVIEVEVELAPHDVYIPDLAGWRRERVPVLPDERPVRIIPDWVCEVVSPSTGRYDRVLKAHGYLAAGVRHYWLVDTDIRVLEALAASGDAWIRIGAWSDGDVARIPPFDAIEIEVGLLFPPLPS